MSPADDSALHAEFQQLHPGMTTEHELYAELFDDWAAERYAAAADEAREPRWVR